MLEWILTLSQHSTQKGAKMDNSLSAYTQKYDKEGYGLQYPDGHVIRFYERILKYKLSKTSGKLLDFGCGNGVHSKYFKNITGGGIEPYGIDIVPSLKKVWEKDPCLDSKNFHIISPNSSFKNSSIQKWILYLQIKAYIILQNKLLKKLCKNFMNYAMRELLYLQL